MIWLFLRTKWLKRGINFYHFLSWKFKCIYTGRQNSEYSYCILFNRNIKGFGREKFNQSFLHESPGDSPA